MTKDKEMIISEILKNIPKHIVKKAIRQTWNISKGTSSSIYAGFRVKDGKATAESGFMCNKCKFRTESDTDIIKHINKLHPPQAPKEWICKCRKLKFECKKHENR